MVAQQDERIGIVGLGLMGMALGARLIDAGVAPVGFDIDPARGASFAAAGGVLAASVADTVARSRIVLIAVFDAAQVQALLADLARPAMPTRPVLICTTTCVPQEIAAIAGHAALAGFPLVEMPLSGTSAEVRHGSALALITGPREAIAAAQDVLEIICPERIALPAIGDAARLKLAINLILQSNRAALAEGIAFAEAMGLNGEAFLAAVRRSAAYSRVMDIKAEKMLKGDFAPQSRIAQTLKDAELILKEADSHDLPLPMTSTQAALLRKAIALAGPDADSAAIIEAVRAGRRQSERPS
ncbi:NAD(P)-dependent oxidoreductase [Bradyrhizobium sp. NP1]|uniref:NAD(P)-dependent oxidoreductase n=1 Tax=Bradyrhizobium sp. NP1 TaxID=3049772 RepID=UPI0025A67544|nr:NAD(P)-dependent oxidoreductase [Bradyrhizobium sp. NP1]WJR80458.1 NAD(P)-dependent oxidoreductase [Bradyrhizobium sp. NP1]